MAVSVQPRGPNAHQLRVTHKLLPRPFFHTFRGAGSESQARAYGQQLHALLVRGIVPQELLASTPARGADPLLVEVIRGYTQAAPITDSDDALLDHMMEELAGVRAGQMTFAWADGYVRRLKKRKLAPSTIRKRVGVLGRILDWHLHRTTPAGTVPLANALRLLPTGYSTYSRAEVAELGLQVDQVPRDRARDRRLAPGELERIEAALSGAKREWRERALAIDPEFSMLFWLILDTGLRLREAYTLRADQFDLQRAFINVEGTKGHRGAAKPRTVPLRPDLVAQLRRYLHGRVGRVFGFWDGTPAGLKPCTARLSARFAVLFDYAQVPDFTEHDLRHEATCRWVAIRAPAGGWMFSELEICKIMGWSSADMMLVYASLRAEDLSARLLPASATQKITG
jgi:integrase